MQNIIAWQEKIRCTALEPERPIRMVARSASLSVYPPATAGHSEFLVQKSFPVKFNLFEWNYFLISIGGGI